jgi:hypothetical protein
VRSIYRRRWQWWPPTDLTRWWLPRIIRTADEFCNPSLLVVVPPLGALVLFWKPGRMRVEADGPCAVCLADEERDRAAGWTVVR